jgi:type VI protein secretion system component VasF
VLERILRAASLVACLAVVAGWLFFAYDQTKSASDLSRAQIAGQAAARKVDPSPDQERTRDALHAQPRRAIDDANDVLLKPFAGVAGDAGSKWLRRSVPAGLALLVYGVGVGFLLRYSRGRA